MAEKKFPATVDDDDVNSESYQTFDRLEYKYDVETGKSIDVKRSMKSRIVAGEPRIITDELE